jgi:hypothetical protein
MLSAAPVERQKQPARIKSQKSWPSQLAGVDFLIAFFPKILVSPAKADAPSCADFIKPSCPYVRASILAATREQGGKRPWR